MNKTFLVFQRLLGELPLSAEDLENVFDSLDSDGNGFLTLEEFSSGFSGSFYTFFHSFIVTNIVLLYKNLFKNHHKNFIGGGCGLVVREMVVVIRRLLLSEAQRNP